LFIGTDQGLQSLARCKQHASHHGGRKACMSMSKAKLNIEPENLSFMTTEQSLSLVHETKNALCNTPAQQVWSPQSRSIKHPSWKIIFFPWRTAGMMLYIYSCQYGISISCPCSESSCSSNKRTTLMPWQKKRLQQLEKMSRFKGTSTAWTRYVIELEQGDKRRLNARRDWRRCVDHRDLCWCNALLERRAWNKRSNVWSYQLLAGSMNIWLTWVDDGDRVVWILSVDCWND